MNVREVNCIDDLGGYRDRWEALLTVAKDDDLFHTYAWHRTWLAHFWCDKPIAFLFVEEHGATIGLAPFLVDRKGEIWCRDSLVFPVNAHAARADLIHTGEATAMWDRVLEHLRCTRRSVRLGLRGVPGASGTLSAVAVLTVAHHMGSALRPGLASPVIRLGTWDEYLHGRSAHFRREMRRKEQRMEREGRLEVRVFTSVEDCRPAMQAIMEIEARSWKQEAGTSFAATPGLEGFYRDLALACAAEGWLRIYVLELDSRPLAYVFGILHRNVLNALKTSYSEAHRLLSPGAVLFGRLLRDGCERGWSAMDLLGDRARWKQELTDEVNQHVDVCAFSNALLRCRLCRLCNQRLKPFIKGAAPGMVRLKRRIERAMGRS